MHDSDYLQRANSAALRFLSYRPRSKAEVRTRLRRQFPSHIVEQVIENLSEQALLDDSKFALLWAQSRNNHKPRSISAIRRELLSKGIERNTADVAVRDIDDQDSAHRAGLKFAGQADTSDYEAFRRKLWGYLQRRGYSYAVSRKTINLLWNELRDDARQAFPSEKD